MSTRSTLTPRSSDLHRLARRRLMPAALACACACAAGSGAQAAEAAPVPAQRVSFSVSASTEVTRDWLTVTLQVLRDGADANQVQAGLKQTLEAALTEARRVAQPGALEVRTGNFNLQPRYNREGRPNGWTGTADLVLEGRDTGRIATAAGKLAGMNIIGTGYSISRELRGKHEAELVAQAIQNWRARADLITREFGYAGYTLADVNVASVDSDGPRPQPMMRVSMAMASAEAAPLPTEAGKGLISATVQGSVQLNR